MNKRRLKRIREARVVQSAEPEICNLMTRDRNLPRAPISKPKNDVKTPSKSTYKVWSGM